MTRMEQINIGGRGVDVYLPPSYLTSNKRYPVVYVYEGGELIKQCVNHVYRLYLEGWLPQLILAGIEASDGREEYMPFGEGRA
ncbi:alpha/beta hydrolase-fold protein [Cohnella sp. GCM10020058]|uniref:alpha/beta hydrolase-fold protein n=1 Tax=Cohnella sp. GCM10020058 TaxID=3317330 RepID=UPI003642B180